MYKMILSDLDETLLIEHHVPSFNKDAIDQVRELGVKFVPATGRAYDAVKDVLKEIGTYEKENEYTICYNGGLILENKNARILSFTGLPFEVTKEIFDYGLHYDVCIMIFTLECCYLFNADPLEVSRKIEQNASFKVIDDNNMDFLKGAKIAKILFERRNMDYLKSIEDELKDKVKDKVDISYSSYRYLEFNARDVNKGSALRWLADYLDIEVRDVIAIGDNYNDIDMLKGAGFSACVSSSYQDIKDIVDYVCTKDYHEGAVKEVIENIVLEGLYEV